jgi:hypothetical protein
MIVVQPLTIAEIFDRAVTLIVHRWRAALPLGIAIAMPGLALDLAFPYPPAVRHHLFGWMALGLANLVVSVLGTIALAFLFAGPDGATLAQVVRRPFAAPWRYARAALLYTVIACFVAVPVVVLLSVARTAGIGGVVVVSLVCFVPLLFVLFEISLAFIGCAIEGTGAVASLQNAWRRSYRPGLRRHTVLLAVGVQGVQVVPTFGLFQASIMLHVHRAWMDQLSDVFVSPLTWIFGVALTTVAVVDYRLRAEGNDLDAALDGAPAPA